MNDTPTDTTAPDAITQAKSLDDKVAPFVEAYEFRHDDGGAYTPNDADRAMLEDAIHGFIADHVPADAHRRLAAHGAGEGLRVASEEWRKWADQVENGGGLRARQAAESINRVIKALDPPATDAGFTTREGEEGVPAGMKPWAGGDAAPADWDGGRVLFRDGTLSVQAPQWVWRWKQPPYFRDIVAYTAKATTSSPDASPDSGEEQ